MEEHIAILNKAVRTDFFEKVTSEQNYRHKGVSHASIWVSGSTVFQTEEIICHKDLK